MILRLPVLLLVALAVPASAARAADCSAAAVGDGVLLVDGAQVVAWDDFDQDHHVEHIMACLKPDGAPRELITLQDDLDDRAGDFVAGGPFVAWDGSTMGGRYFSLVADVRTGVTRRLIARQVVLDSGGTGAAAGIDAHSFAGVQYYAPGSTKAVVVDPLPVNDKGLAVSGGTVTFRHGSRTFHARVAGRALPGPRRRRSACSVLSRSAVKRIDGGPAFSYSGPLTDLADWTSACQWTSSRAQLTVAYDTGYTAAARAVVLRILRSSPRLHRVRVGSSIVYRARDGKSVYAVRGGTLVALRGELAVPASAATRALRGLGY